jgi:hypothetical protein
MHTKFKLLKRLGYGFKDKEVYIKNGAFLFATDRFFTPLLARDPSFCL